MRRIIGMVLLLLTAHSTALAATKDEEKVLYKYQQVVTLQWKLAKGLKLDVEPEIRWNEGYDKFLLNTGLSYKTWSCIYWGATYRLEVEPTSNDRTNLSHRYALDLTYKEDWGRFTPSLRVRYNNFADEEVTDEAYLRYKAKLAYNIPHCKVTPSLSAEAYQEMGEGRLYKMRYAAGVDYNITKHSALSLDYKLDYFILAYKRAHIFGIGYKYKF